MELQVKENKRQNQILKLAIARLQTEFQKLKEKTGDTFVTQAGVDGHPEERKDLTIEEIFELLTRYVTKFLNLTYKDTKFDT